MQKYKPINTFSQRPSLAQIVAYLLFASQIVLFAVIIQKHYVSHSMRIAMIIVYSTVVVGHIVITVLTSYSDPSDDFMIRYRNDRDSVKNEAIGFMLYCDICRSYVKKTSKHCRMCKRCVQGFDHHCIWINNCVGSKNYKIFLIMLGLTLTSLLMYLINIILLWRQGNYKQFMAQMAVVWASGIIIIVFIVLVLNLIFLHIYLFYLGMTTFDFLTQEKFKGQNKRLVNSQQQNATNEAVFGENVHSTQLSQMNLVEARAKKQNATNDTSKPAEKTDKQGMNSTFKKNLQNLEAKGQKVYPTNQDEQKKEENIFQNDNQTVKTEQNDKQSARISQYFVESKSIKMLVSHDATRPDKVKLDKIHPLTSTNSKEMNSKKTAKKWHTITIQKTPKH